MKFEEFKVGQRFRTSTRTLSEAEIIDFASQWDRQSFHLDPVAAEASIFGGLIASGFHTLLIAFDLIIESTIWTGISQGSPGIEELRWLKPVRPGDTLQVEMEVAAIRTSESRPDRGYITWDQTVSNQSGDAVLTYRSVLICARDPA